ncbi:MAG: methyltransferase, partial [Cyanobacteria bacterium J06648_11]
ITRRYLKRQGRLTRLALAQLRDDEEETSDRPDSAQTETALERPLSLNQQRMTAVVEMLKRHGAKRVADFGCGEGKLLKALLAEPSFEAIAGIDVSPRVLEKARDRLHLFRLPERQRDRLQLWHGSLLYADERLQDYEAVAVVEVIEHMEGDRLSTFEQVVFEVQRPQLAIVTTPNREYNVRFEGLPAGKLRHRDHRFEWTRAEFEAWARGVGDRHGYRVEFYPIGAADDEVGAPTQMGVFEK